MQHMFQWASSRLVVRKHNTEVVSLLAALQPFWWCRVLHDPLGRLKICSGLLWARPQGTHCCLSANIICVILFAAVLCDVLR